MRASFRISMVFLTALAIGLAAVPSARATGYAQRVLYSFTGSGSDGQNPNGPLIMDANGNLFGTTPFGGTNGGGNVFELVKSSSGTYGEKVLYSFTYGADGGSPNGGLVIDAAGNLFGTTLQGGANGLGTVFELVNSSGTYTETVLHSFTGGADGQEPNSGLVSDAAGNLYGTTYNANCFCDAGAVFELVNSSGTYTEKLLFNFNSAGAIGSGPMGPLVIDASRNLFGTTGGSVFELVNSSGTYSETVLHSFTGMPDGAGVNGGLVRDAAGNLYGTTKAGGNDPNCNPGCGTVFELVNSSGTYTETILHSFTFASDNVQAPNGGLVRDAAGNLYGTAGGGNQGEGTVFELVNSSGTYTVGVLHSFFFGCVNDGSAPQGVLLMDTSGNLYGVTYAGGLGYGTVFELASFTGQAAATQTNLTSSLNPATAGDPVNFTATVTSRGNSGFLLSGTITLSNGSLVLATVPLACGGTTQSPNGTGLTLEDADAIGIGVNTLTAKFTPDTAAFAPSSTTLNQMVIEPGAAVTTGNNTFSGNQTVNGTVNATSLVAGSVAIGGGTPITEYASITDGITLPVLVPLSCARFTTAAVTGFTPGASDTIALGTPSSLLTGLGNGVFLVYQAWETTTTASPTITIQVCNPSGSRYAGGASGTIRVSIFKH